MFREYLNETYLLTGHFSKRKRKALAMSLEHDAIRLALFVSILQFKNSVTLNSRKQEQLISAENQRTRRTKTSKRKTCRRAPKFVRCFSILLQIASHCHYTHVA